MADSTGPTGDGSVVPEQTAVAKFQQWLRDKKCTRYAGVTTRYGWRRPTQQLLAQFLISDYGKKYVSTADAARLTAWVTEKLTPEMLMDATPSAETIEKYRMPPVPPAPVVTTERCDGKTAQEWRALYFHVLGQLHEQNAQLYSGDES